MSLNIGDDERVHFGSKESLFGEPPAGDDWDWQKLLKDAEEFAKSGKVSREEAMAGLERGVAGVREFFKSESDMEAKTHVPSEEAEKLAAMTALHLAKNQGKVKPEEFVFFVRLAWALGRAYGERSGKPE